LHRFSRANEHVDFDLWENIFPCYARSLTRVSLTVILLTDPGHVPHSLLPPVTGVDLSKILGETKILGGGKGGNY